MAFVTPLVHADDAFIESEPPSDAVDDEAIVGVIDIEKAQHCDFMTICCMDPISPYGYHSFDVGDCPGFLEDHLADGEWNIMRDAMNKPLLAASKKKQVAMVVATGPLLSLLIALIGVWTYDSENVQMACQVIAAIALQWSLIGFFVGACWVPTAFERALVEACDEAQDRFPKYVFAPVSSSDVANAKARHAFHRKWFIAVALSAEHLKRQDIVDRYGERAAMNRDHYVHLTV